MIERMFCGHSFRIFRREVTFLPYSVHCKQKTLFLRNMLTMINMHLLHAVTLYIHTFLYLTLTKTLENFITKLLMGTRENREDK